MSERIRDLSAGVAGLIGVVLVLVGAFIAGQPPLVDDPAGEIRAHFADNRTLLLIGGFCNMLAVPFLAWFIVSVRARLAAADETPLPVVVLATLFLLGGLALAAVAIGGGLFYLDGFAAAASDELVRAVVSTQVLIYGYAAIGFVIVLGAFGISALRGESFPVWNAWVAIALVSLLAVLAPGLSLLGFPSFLAFVA